jgi:quercetin dioxygenase-like cupin family protein
VSLLPPPVGRNPMPVLYPLVATLALVCAVTSNPNRRSNIQIRVPGGGNSMRNLGLFVTFVLLFAGSARHGIAQEHAPVMITRLYTGADGMSHFEQVDVKFSHETGAPNTVSESEPISPKKSYIVRIAPGFFEDWHNADVRRYIVTVSGRSEVEVTSGQRFVAAPGQVILAEDLTGKGHTFRVLGDSDWVALFVDMEK